AVRPTTRAFATAFLHHLHPPPPALTLFPYTTLFRSPDGALRPQRGRPPEQRAPEARPRLGAHPHRARHRLSPGKGLSRCRARCRSEEHTSELQSLAYLVCRLLLEKKNQKIHNSEYAP